MSVNQFDQACRYLAKLEPVSFLAWLFELSPEQFHFRGWIDTRRIKFPGEPDRTCDTVAFLQNAEAGGEPWAVPVEFQSEPDPDMFARMLGYLSGLGLELRPSDNPGDRYFLGAAVLNLTGKGNTSRSMSWPAAGLLTHLGVCERNPASEDARATLDAILAGKTTPIVLPLIPLMRGGDEAGIISDWKSLAFAEPDTRRRADYGGLAVVFAEAAKRLEVWAKALEGWNVTESKQVQEWQAQAKIQGREEGKLVARIQYSQRLLNQPISSDDELFRETREELARIAKRLESQTLPRTNGHS